jgi:D-threo-aldose 1-dehydrogenase
MDPLELRAIGRTGVEVTRLGFGSATLGDLWEVIPESQADSTIDAAHAAGIRFFDTAPWYGCGKSEHRIGRTLRSKPRESFVLSTKIGRVLFRPRDAQRFRHPRWAGPLAFDLRFDYTREGVLRAYEDSLQRLGINTVDALLIHDLDVAYQQDEPGVQAAFRQLESGGGFRALDDLKRAGEIRAVGAGINVTGMIPRFLEQFAIDFFLLAMPYTLLDQPALESDLPLCASQGVGIVIGAPFASGILATGPRAGAVYGYEPAQQEMIEKARKIEAICRRYDVPLGAAALQFPLAHECVASVIPGPNAPQQVAKNLEWMRLDIPADLWAELKSARLLNPDAPTP